MTDKYKQMKEDFFHIPIPKFHAICHLDTNQKVNIYIIDGTIL